MSFSFPDSVLGQHIGILGKTGGGKSSTAKLIIEQVVAHGARVCILDPIKSDWWGLASSASGKRAGLPFYILGGPHGHVPLHDSAGKAIAEIVAGGALPLSILDMADFPPGGQSRFFVDFAQTLIRKMRGVVYLVIEEAHLFAPKERSGIGAENMSIHWAKTLATAGRSKGIRLIVLSQRTQALHNAVLGSCDTLIAHRLTAPADQLPVNKWLAANVSKDKAAEIAASLGKLKTGEGWICSGEAQLFERRQFPRITTYDNTVAPKDSDGQRAVKMSEVDADALRAIIGTAVAEAEANDPAKLRKRIAELEREVKAKPAAMADRAAIEKACRAAVVERDALWADDFHRHNMPRVEALQRASELLTDAAKAVDQATKDWMKPQSTPNGKPAAHATPTRAPAPRSTVRPKSKSDAAGDAQEPQGGLAPGEKKILAAIAQNIHGADKRQISVLAGYKRSSRDTYIYRLQSRGLIEPDGGLFVVTDAGLAALGDDHDPLPTGVDLQQHWLATLKGGEAAILALLIEAHPNYVPVDKISEATGYKRSSRDTFIYKLKARQLVVGERGQVRASDNLF